VVWNPALWGGIDGEIATTLNSARRRRLALSVMLPATIARAGDGGATRGLVRQKRCARPRRFSRFQAMALQVV
jgi:hypothetical protein